MKLFPEDPVFVIGEKGFDDKDVDGQPLDVLGRKALGQKLTDLVERIDQPLVIALDGGWGSGKSHFLKLWTGAHGKELGGKAEVIYFDAFEHDYLDDPLISLVSQLTTKKAAKTWGKKAVSAIKSKAIPLGKLAARFGLGLATYSATEAAGVLADIAINKVSEATDDKIDEFWQAESGRIAAMQGFRDALKSLTGEGDAARKIVFIIDELDRCRPDYALSLLEIIKHFFAVPNVHFVLGVNLKELESSVRARYGAGIGATKYLQKFVSLTMHLPKASDKVNHDKTSLDYFNLHSNGFIKNDNLRDRATVRLEQIVQEQEVSLRDVQRLLTCFALIPSTFNQVEGRFRPLVVGAVFLKVLHRDVYARFGEERLSFEDAAAALSLKRPDTEDYYDVGRTDWAFWALRLIGKDWMSVLNLTVSEAAAIPLDIQNLTAARQDSIRRILAEMLDSFSLTSP